MKELICPNCGNIGTPKTITKGSFLIEVILWLFFVIPGIIYGIWRLSTRYKACPSCGAKNMVPLDSLMGKKLKNEFKGYIFDLQKASKNEAQSL